MVDPAILCRKHLLGEHGELHKHRHNFEKKYSMQKRIALGQIEPSSMQDRHDLLANEMLRRNYNHHSPYSQPDISYLPEAHQAFRVDVQSALEDLISRCPECARRFKELETSIRNDALVE